MKKHKSKQKSKKAILIDRPPLNLASNPEVIYLGKGDNLLEVNLRKSIRAKSVRIKILASQNIELVIPHNASLAQIKQAHQFLQQQEKELRAKLAELEPIMAIAKGIPKSLPIFDQEYPIIINISTLKETVLHENDQLIVYSRGNESKIEWLLVNYLQQLIAKEISVYVELISKKLQVTYKKITIKDVRSYWGCYSTNGHLSFSWRIVLDFGSFLS